MSYSVGERVLFEGLHFIVTSGMRVGLVGPNGSGKTTLLRLLTGELEPTSGTIKRAASLKIVYFSQMRELEEGVTLRRALAPDSDSVVYQGRVVHVASYATKFLFTSEQLNQPVERLSGGERARVLIAKLMLEPADVLVDSMRGRSYSWTRIRLNLRHVPEAQRPPQEPLVIDYDPWTQGEGPRRRR